MFNGGRTSTTKSNSCRGLTADDLEVAEILLSLPRLIYLTIRWARQKKRSAIKSVIKSNTSPNRTLTPSPAPETLKIKPKSSSPTSPLSAGSDEKFNHITQEVPKRKVSKKIEELRKKVAALEKKKKILAEEVEKVRAYHKKLLADKKQLLVILTSTGEEDQQQQMQCNIHKEEQHITRLQWPTTVIGTFLPFGVGSHHPNNFALIVPADETSRPWDRVMNARYRKAQLAAQTRRRRMHVLREKRK